MKPLFIMFAFYFVAASASACPNLAGHYLLQGEDGVVRYTVRQKGCERVEIERRTTSARPPRSKLRNLLSMGNRTGNLARSVVGWATNSKLDQLQITCTTEPIQLGIFI